MYLIIRFTCKSQEQCGESGEPGSHSKTEQGSIESRLTLKTNISLRKKATVLKFPSQILGLPLDGRSREGGRAGREERSCFLSLRRAGSVGSGRVGSIMAVGTPARVTLVNLSAPPSSRRESKWQTLMGQMAGSPRWHFVISDGALGPSRRTVKCHCLKTAVCMNLA